MESVFAINKPQNNLIHLKSSGIILYAILDIYKRPHLKYVQLGSKITFCLTWKISTQNINKKEEISILESTDFSKGKYWMYIVQINFFWRSTEKLSPILKIVKSKLRLPNFYLDWLPNTIAWLKNKTSIFFSLPLKELIFKY